MPWGPRRRSFGFMTTATTDIEGPREQLLADLPVGERAVRAAGLETALLEGGEGAPVVLLHGPGESGLKWGAILPELAGSNQAVAPDLPAHGGTEVPAAFDAELTNAWLADLIEATCDRPPLLVGHVLGGAIAARFAVEHGERLAGLVLVDSLGLGRFRPAPRFALDLVRFVRRPTERSYDRFMRQCSYDLDGLREGMGERWQPFVAHNLELARAPSAKQAGKLMKRVGVPRIPPAELDRIGVPTTLIWGRQDRANKLRIAECASARHGWPLRVIEDCADDPPRDRPSEFLAALRPALEAAAAR
jgi:pimeloyl-ACP methyl ester carboxylesterase